MLPSCSSMLLLVTAMTLYKRKGRQCILLAHCTKHGNLSHHMHQNNFVGVT